MRPPRATAHAARAAAAALALVWLAGCVSLLSLNDEDHVELAGQTCDLVRSTCDGVYDLKLVWGTTRTCEDVLTEATSDGGTVTADELGACFELTTCLEILDCLADYNVYQLTGAETCRALDEPCLQTCFVDDCVSPHKCCNTICQDGVCQ